jgi:signal transduction histidine kinase
MVLERQKFDIYKTLNGIVKILKERCRENKQTLTLVCDKRIGNIVADEIRLKHVLFKLISNSIKFTKEGGVITLGAEDIDNNQIRIWVEDTGIGIDAEDKKKVFERFFKTRSAQVMQKSGAGLGLAVVKNIIELHNGTVTIDSESGKGTIINIILQKDFQSDKKPGILAV